MSAIKLQKSIICILLVIGTCLSFAEEDEKRKAVETAIEEAGVAVEQLSFEKRELIQLHLQRGEKFLAGGEIDKAEKEFKTVLEISPDEKRAIAYLRDIQDIREIMKREEKRKKRLALLKEGEERGEALERIKREKRGEERESKILKRKRTLTKEQQIDEHIRQGKEYYAQEKYAEAVEEWQKVLALTQPSDRDYQRMLNWIHAAKAAEQRRRKRIAITKKKESEDMASLDVEEAWSVKDVGVERRKEGKEEIEGVVSPAKLRLEKKARQLISLDFENAHLRKVMRYLSKVSGINIVLDENVFPIGFEGEGEAAPAAAVPIPDEEAAITDAQAPVEEKVTLGDISPRVTIRLKDIPLIEALDVILRTKGLNYRLEENIIWITTEENLAAGELVTKSYKPSSGIGDILGMLLKTVPFDMETDVTPDSVEGAEVPGPPGSKISVDKTSGIIFITNTAMNQRLAEDIIRRLAETPPQASIETKFVDIDTGAFAQLGIQWKITEPFEGASSDAYIGGTSFSGGKPTTGPGIELDVDEDSSGIFAKYAKLTPTQFEAVLQALETSGKSNLLSAPKVTVINNYTATIDISTSFGYVESYSLEEETIEIGGDDFKITTALPDETATRKVGVMLEVTPGIGADRKIINLSLIPQVIEHIGWIEYGTERFSIKQPVFEVRYVTTNVDVSDGGTIVLGGLIKGTEVKSAKQVPFLGRIPILGSLFRSTSTTSTKRELLIFVTARILEPTGEPLVR